MNPDNQDLKRYAANYLREQDGMALYRALAAAEKSKDRVRIFEQLAVAEEKHAARWANLLRKSGATVPAYRTSVRVAVLGWIARRLGTEHVLPVVSGFESSAQDEYAGQTEATGIPAEERGHRRTLNAMQTQTEGGSESILKVERWHRTSYGGTLRAAVFGVNDGLVSNFSLVMGVAGANADSQFVLLAGVAGLLAGASSMAAGEYVSVKSQRELYEQQIALERQELEMAPEEEAAELALIYQAKGIPAAQAEELAARIISNPATALDTLAREELGLDPTTLGSPWLAAGSSFVAFAAGAIVPVVPYLIITGDTAFLLSAAMSAIGLFAVGAAISVFTARNLVASGLRMVGIGALAAAATYFIGRLLGVSV